MFSLSSCTSRSHGFHTARALAEQGNSIQNRIQKRFSVSVTEQSPFGFRPTSFPFSLGATARVLRVKPESVIKITEDPHIKDRYQVHVAGYEDLSYVEKLGLSHSFSISVNNKERYISLTFTTDMKDEIWEVFYTYVTAQALHFEVGRAFNIDPLRILNLGIGVRHSLRVYMRYDGDTKPSICVEDLAKFGGFEVRFDLQGKDTYFDIFCDDRKTWIKLWQYIRERNTELE